MKPITKLGSEIEESKNRVREMAQQLRALAALAEDLGSVPSTHTVVHNHLKLHFWGNMVSCSDFCEHQTHVWSTYADAGKTVIHI